VDVRYAARMTGVRPSAIRELLKFGDDPSITSFGGGYPDPALFPMDEFRHVFQEVLADKNRNLLQYTASVGLPGLRKQIAGRMLLDGVACDLDDVLVLQGAQQGLDIVAKMLIDPGDVIITENPTFLGALIAFNPYQPEYRAIRMDAEGIDVEELERVLKSTPRAKFIYVIPEFQNPTGVTMSLARRKRVIELAEEFGLLILEDTPYRELRFEGEQLPSLKRLDSSDRVIHLRSFAKTLAPGLRMGWMTARRDILEKAGLLKLAADTQSSTLNMAATQLYLERYNLDEHLVVVREVYRSKRDLMLDTMRRCFPDGIQFTKPEGGLFTWVTFPEGFDTERFMAERAVPDAKVAYVPGRTFYPGLDESRHARFSYSGVPDRRMVDAISRLGALLHEERRPARTEHDLVAARATSGPI
jgi:2-aminoadipate transaminase